MPATKFLKLKEAVRLVESEIFKCRTRAGEYSASLGDGGGSRGGQGEATGGEGGGGEGEAGEQNATNANKRGSASEKALLPRHVFAERLDAIWYARERASACTKTALRHQPKLDNVDIVN